MIKCFEIVTVYILGERNEHCHRNSFEHVKQKTKKINCAVCCLPNICWCTRQSRSRFQNESLYTNVAKWIVLIFNLQNISNKMSANERFQWIIRMNVSCFMNKNPTGQLRWVREKNLDDKKANKWIPTKKSHFKRQIIALMNHFKVFGICFVYILHKIQVQLNGSLSISLSGPDNSQWLSAIPFLLKRIPKEILAIFAHRSNWNEWHFIGCLS